MSTRRDLITLLGGAAAMPLAARAQQPAIPVTGFRKRCCNPRLAGSLRECLMQW
jgi:hypothetical protein